MKKKIYAVGNAHLDPVWMWRWQEGSCEAKATIRSALDRMKEYPEFRFVCSSAVVFGWIEEFDPEMFSEIRRRISEGRFIIVGGWMVQPDCNNPSGESFARQGLYAQRYFKEKFGVTAKVGYNVDSFGHHAMMPQILRKSGMDYYFFMRPSPVEKEMESSLFFWQSQDGSEVLAYRLARKYNFNFSTGNELDEILGWINDAADTDVDAVPLFYGVGNHGGGPTKQNIELLSAYRKAHPECEVVFSNGKDFFEECLAEGKEIARYQGDLQHHASGCYSAVWAIKDLIRRCENELYAAEVFSGMGTRLLGRTYPLEKLGEAWKNLCFCQFHDSMGGCSVYDVYSDMDYIGKESLSIAARLQNNALQSISWAVDTRDSQGLPIVIFNPHTWEISESVRINKQVSRILAPDGNPVAVQHVYSPTAPCYGRSDTLFRATVPALGYVTYFIADEELVRDSPAPDAGVKNDVTGEVTEASDVRACGQTLENSCLRVTFDPHTGFISELYDKEKDRMWLLNDGAVPVVIDEYGHDTWSHGKNFFDRSIGVFCDAELTVLESGPVRACIKVVSRYNRSTLTQYFMLESGERMLRVRASVDWHEKHKMLKLAYPMAVTSPTARYEIPFGMLERPADGEEEPGLMWVAVCGEDASYTIINCNKYSFSVKDSTMYLTVVRSPIYGDHGKGRSQESRFTDQGYHEFSYALAEFDPASVGKTVKSARQFNLHTVNILENRHEGHLPLSWSGLEVSDDGVIISAWKRSEDRNGWILRAYETDGREKEVTFSGALLDKKLTVKFGAYEIKTCFLLDGGEWQEVLMTEMNM